MKKSTGAAGKRQIYDLSTNLFFRFGRQLKELALPMITQRANLHYSPVGMRIKALYPVWSTYHVIRALYCFPLLRTAQQGCGHWVGNTSECLDRSFNSAFFLLFVISLEWVIHMYAYLLSTLWLLLFCSCRRGCGMLKIQLPTDLQGEKAVVSWSVLVWSCQFTPFA